MHSRILFRRNIPTKFLTQSAAQGTTNEVAGRTPAEGIEGPEEGSSRLAVEAGHRHTQNRVRGRVQFSVTDQRTA